MSQSPTPDSLWKGLPSWLFFTFLVIGPPAALVTFARTITQNPVHIVLLVLSYEVLLFLGQFAGKVWKQLEEPLITYLVRWITTHVKEMTSRSYRQYCRYMVAEHQVFDIKGLSTRTAHDLELKQVFVDLHLHPLPPHQASTDPIHVPKSLQGTHSLWEYLSSPAQTNSHLVILGAPGSGKTTLLKHLALTLVQPKQSRRHLHSHSLPILLFLRDHVQAIIQQSSFSLANAVEEHMQEKWQQSIPASWIEQYLKRGKCLILLDGLDEVADQTTRKSVVTWVGRQMIAYGLNRFVLTSRPYGYRENPLDGVTVLDVQAFNLDQVERFIQNWYLANEFKSWGKDDLSAKLHAHEGTQDLLRRLHQAPALLSLAVNPLLLTMITTVHRYRGSLPGKRVALYAEICEVFLGKRREARGIIDELSPAQKQLVLQSLACWMMLHDRREVAYEKALQVIGPALARVNTQMQAADFLHLIENASGLLLEKKPGIYGFAHLTFQEYLAAVYIKEKGIEHVLVSRVTDSWWHETIRLYCAQADATGIIQACLKGSPPSVEALALAFECDEEKLTLQPQVQAQLNAVLKTNLEDADHQRRQLIAEILLARRLHQMISTQQGTYIDTSFVTCAEYQVFLDEQRVQGHYHQPDHWGTFSFPQGSANTPVLGIRRSDVQAFCAWLTARDKEGWRYRLPRTGEWPLKEKAQWNASYAEMGYWTSDASRFEWVHKTTPITLQQRPDVVLNNARYLDLIPKQILDLDLIHDLALINDSTNNVIHISTPILNLARESDYALNRRHVRTLINATSTHTRDHISNLIDDLAVNLVADLAHSYEKERDRARALARTLEHTHKLSPASNRVPNLVSALISAHNLIHNLTHAYESESTYVRAFQNTLNLSPVSNRVHSLANALTSTYNLIRLLVSTHGFTYALINTYDLIRLLISTHDFAHSLALISVKTSSPSITNTNAILHASDLVRALVIQLTLLFLQERIVGNFQAYEGILLVKERPSAE